MSHLSTLALGTTPSTAVYSQAQPMPHQATSSIASNTYQPDKRWLIPKTSDTLILGGLGLLSGITISEMNVQGLKKTASIALNDIETSLAQATSIDTSQLHEKGNALYRQEGWVKHPLFMTFLMPFVHPELAPAALVYAMALGGVFIGSNVFQGIQESWVRWEESCIRANLVHGLQPAFQQSIQLKLQSDAQLRQETESTLNTLFPKTESSNTEANTSNSRQLFPEQQDSEFVYMPFNRDKRLLHTRSTASLAPRSSEGSPVIPSNSCPSLLSTPPTSKSSEINSTPLQTFDPIIGQNWGRLGILGFTALGGLGLGILLNTTRHLLQNQGLQTMAQRLHPRLRVNLLPNDQEAVALFFKDSWPVLISLAALGATLKVSELLIEGLREIQVTTMNAKTEAQYERYKWQTLDPQFHAIAERTYVEESIKALKADAPNLNPHDITERKQRILDGIGYHSSPAYYPITPMVQLVPARG